MREVRRTGLVGVLATAAALILGVSPAGAANLPVDSAADSASDPLPNNGCEATGGDECTLREAIEAANGNGSLEIDQVPIGVTGIINLQSSLPQITTPTTISGPGAANLTIRRQIGTTVLVTAPATNQDVVRVEDVTIADGTTGVVAQGSGLAVFDRVWIRNNIQTAAAGGGLLAGGNADVSIRESTLSGNQATGGGGIYGTSTASIEIINSTITGNSTIGNGGGILTDSTATVAVRSSSIVGNTADSDNTGVGESGGGTFIGGGPVHGITLGNTILADNKIGTLSAVPNQCAGTKTYVSLGYNLRTTADMTCPWDPPSGAVGDLVNPNAGLGALDLNSLPTPTIPLLPGSPAIDAGNPAAVGSTAAACPLTDQRGLPRGGLNGRCDIGAFEVQVPPPAAAAQPPAGTPATRRRCKKGFRLKTVRTKSGKKKKKCVRKKKRR